MQFLHWWKTLFLVFLTLIDDSLRESFYLLLGYIQSLHSYHPSYISSYENAATDNSTLSFSTQYAGVCRKLRLRKLRPQTPSYHENSDPRKTQIPSYRENSDSSVSRELRPPKPFDVAVVLQFIALRNTNTALKTIASSRCVYALSVDNCHGERNLHKAKLLAFGEA